MANFFFLQPSYGLAIVGLFFNPFVVNVHTPRVPREKTSLIRFRILQYSSTVVYPKEAFFIITLYYSMLELATSGSPTPMMATHTVYHTEYVLYSEYCTLVL